MSWTLDLRPRQLRPAVSRSASMSCSSASALAISLAIALPLGIWSARRPRVYAVRRRRHRRALHDPGAGAVRAADPAVWASAPRRPITALVLYSLLILMRNIATGLREVPAEVDRGGATAWASAVAHGCWRIELPLALPVIVAGIRIAVVTQISVATVAAYINAGGLGDDHLPGHHQDFGEKIMAGAVWPRCWRSSADEALRRLERRLRAAQAESAHESAWPGHRRRIRRLLRARWRRTSAVGAALLAALAIALPARHLAQPLSARGGSGDQRGQCRCARSRASRSSSSCCRSSAPAFCRRSWR